MSEPPSLFHHRSSPVDLEGAGRPSVHPGAWAPKWINDTLRPLEGLRDPDGPVLTDNMSLDYVHAAVFMLGSDGIVFGTVDGQGVECTAPHVLDRPSR